MPFAKTALFFLLGLAASASAQAPDPNFDAITKPGLHEEVSAGSVYTVEWVAPPTAPKGSVSITLLGGASPGSLVPISDIASTFSGRSLYLVVFSI